MRRLDQDEVERLLAVDVPARLATVDTEGFPHVTPLWFTWSDGAFYMTSIVDRPHLRRVARNPRAGICVDVEEPERPDGERPNRQVRAIGEVVLFPDDGGEWTTRITKKYIRGPAASGRVAARTADERVVMHLRPTSIFGVASL